MSKYANGGKYARYNKDNFSKQAYDNRKVHPLTLATVLMDCVAYIGISYLVVTLLDKIGFISFVQSILF